jgi:hypothetical protein
MVVSCAQEEEETGITFSIIYLSLCCFIEDCYILSTRRRERYI